MKGGIWYAILACSLWGAVIVSPSLLPEFNPVLISCVRFVLYSAFSLLVALPFASSLIGRMTRADAWMLVRLSLTGNIVNFAFLAASVHMSDVTTAALINATMPIAISLMSRKDVGSLSLKRLKLPLSLSVLGILLLTVGHSGVPRPDGTYLSLFIGVGCGVAGVASWAWYAVHNTGYLRASAFSSQEWSTLVGLVTGVVAGAIGGALISFYPRILPIGLSASRWHKFIWVCLFLAIGGSWMANGLWNACSRRIASSLSAQLIVFETLFACLYGFLLEGCLPSKLEVVSILMLVVGAGWAGSIHRVRPPSSKRPA